MANTKHTPAPWKAEMTNYNDGYERWNVSGKKITDLICGVYGGTSEETRANAQLIAAAPEVLEDAEALLNAMSMLPDQQELLPYIKKLESTIAKATL